MHKTNIGHFIKRPLVPDPLETALITVVALAALGSAILLLIHRWVEYSDYLATVAV